MIPRRAKGAEGIRRALIAPCGMNCRLCVAFVRERNPCPGCRHFDSLEPKTIARCRIRTCRRRIQKNLRYCIGCGSFPCDSLGHLDRRYRTRYGMSMLDNLEGIRKSGIRRFIAAEEAKWSCPGCGGLLCVHKPRCISCGRRWREGISL